MKLEYILGIAVVGYLAYEYVRQPSGNLTDIEVAYAAQILHNAGIQPTAANVQAAATIASSDPNSAAYASAKASLVKQGAAAV